MDEVEQLTQTLTRNLMDYNTPLRCMDCGILLGFTTLTEKKKQLAICCYCHHKRSDLL